MANNGRYTTGIRMMLIREYFNANANRTHGVEPQKLKDYLAEYGYDKVDRRSLYNDFAILDTVFGTTITYDPKTRTYLLENPTFEPEELQLIVDSLNASKFITNDQLLKTTDKVRKLADKHTRRTLNRRAVVADRIRDKNENVMKQADRIHEAIGQDRQITFRYFHYSPDKSKEKTYSKSGKGYVVSPFALVWNNGNYYLYAYVSEHSRFQYFRVDRMERIALLAGQQRQGKEAYQERDLTKKTAVVFDMYSGPEYYVQLRFQNRLAHSVIDKFGKDITMIPCDETHFTTTVSVEISPPFFAWVATFGSAAKILEPEPVVEEMKKFLEKAAKMYKDEGEM